ncbi:MAG: hypothetical protein HY927_11055 [Elusimicrobia bacterium]|nr:hypothetical protein [Elusimicrobiota bacterium]
MTKERSVPVRCEPAAYGRLKTLPKEEAGRLAGAIQDAAGSFEFFYKRRNVHPMGLPPMVATRRLAETISSVTRTLFRFQQLAPDLYRGDVGGFAGLIRLEDRTRAWFDATAAAVPKPWPHLMRPDYAVGLRDGAPRLALLELNSLMLGGLHIQSAALRMMREVVLPRLSMSDSSLGLTPTVDLMDYLMVWLKTWRGRRGAREGGIALLENLPPGGGFSELPRILRHLRRAGWRVEHGDPRRLSLRRGRVRLNGMPVAFAFRDFSFEDVGGPRSPSMAAFAELWRQGRVGPGFAADFDQKGILECLSSEAWSSLFTRRQARLLRLHVPWTRVLTCRRTDGPDGRGVDLPSYAVRARESLVLKPSWGSGGEGILIGRRTGPGRWQRTVDLALKEPGSFAVQSYVDNPAIPCVYLRDGRINVRDCRYTVGAFFDGTRFGYHLRLSPGHVVNVAQGGALTPLYLS